MRCGRCLVLPNCRCLVFDCATGCTKLGGDVLLCRVFQAVG